MSERPAAALRYGTRGELRAEGMPRWKAPMLATLTHDRFSDPNWVYERKLDGERCLVFRDGRGPRLRSRNRKDIGPRYPELIEALGEGASGRYVADGEIVAFAGGLTSFSRLQERMQLTDPEAARASGVRVYLYLFDLLHLDGQDTTRLELRDRKALLRDALSFPDPLRYTPHRNEQGERYLREACGKAWEGLIAKRADAPYEHDRSRAWLKLKCSRGQELVIVGYTDPKGSREELGALLVAYNEDGGLRYAGKVGTGFDDETLARLGPMLRGRERRLAPLAGGNPPRGKKVHWVRPELVGEFEFTEWTHDGRLRHPRFRGLRDDKDPSEVVREEPA